MASDDIIRWMAVFWLPDGPHFVHGKTSANFDEAAFGIHLAITQNPDARYDPADVRFRVTPAQIQAETKRIKDMRSSLDLPATAAEAGLGTANEYLQDPTLARELAGNDPEMEPSMADYPASAPRRFAVSRGNDVKEHKANVAAAWRSAISKRKAAAQAERAESPPA